MIWPRSACAPAPSAAAGSSRSRSTHGRMAWSWSWWCCARRAASAVYPLATHGGWSCPVSCGPDVRHHHGCGRGAEWRGVPPRTTARLWNALRRATWRHAVELRSAVHGHELLSLRRQTHRRENGPFSPAFRGRGGGHSYTNLPSVAGHGPWPTARRGQWPEAAFAATTTSHAASEGATRLAGPPPRRRAPWHGAGPRGQACGFLLSPICGITSPTDFSHSHTVLCTPPRRREGGR
jgi:hypothetical protein